MAVWTCTLSDGVTTIDLSENNRVVEKVESPQVTIVQKIDGTLAFDILAHKRTFNVICEFRETDGADTPWDRKENLIDFAMATETNYTFTWDLDTYLVKILNAQVTSMPGHGESFDSVVLNLLEVDPDSR